MTDMPAVPTEPTEDDVVKPKPQPSPNLVRTPKS